MHFKACTLSSLLTAASCAASAVHEIRPMLQLTRTESGVGGVAISIQSSLSCNKISCGFCGLICIEPHMILHWVIRYWVAYGIGSYGIGSQTALDHTALGGMALGHMALGRTA
jgi:hypothetical protein